MPANTVASVPFQPHLVSVDIVTLNGEISLAFQLKRLSPLRIGDTQASPGERGYPGSSDLSLWTGVDELAEPPTNCLGVHNQRTKGRHSLELSWALACHSFSSELIHTRGAVSESGITCVL